MKIILDEQKFDLGLLKRKKPNKYIVNRKELNENIKKNQDFIKKVHSDPYCKRMLAMA